MKRREFIVMSLVERRRCVSERSWFDSLFSACGYEKRAGRQYCTDESDGYDLGLSGYG